MSTTYRITIERIDVVQETEPQWLKGGSNAKSAEHYEYQKPADGVTKRIAKTVLEQTIDTLDMPAVIRAINGLT